MTAYAVPSAPRFKHQPNFKKAKNGARDHRLLNRPRNQSWPGYVVPSKALAQLLDSKMDAIKELIPDYLDSQDDDCWKHALSMQVASIKGGTADAVIRRLWDVMNGRSKIAYVDMADAICLALGIDLDLDTDIPTLPGNYNAARDLIRCRADQHGVKLSRSDEKKYAERAYRIGLLIVNYPHNTERLLDLAPLDCLRPYR